MKESQTMGKTKGETDWSHTWFLKNFEEQWNLSKFIKPYYVQEIRVYVCVCTCVCVSGIDKSNHVTLLQT